MLCFFITPHGTCTLLVRSTHTAPTTTTTSGSLALRIAPLAERIPLSSCREIAHRANLAAPEVQSVDLGYISAGSWMDLGWTSATSQLYLNAGDAIISAASRLHLGCIS
eukprot:CAMPEP_0119379456 /NCGR_PEP_ID=MMETSP1334-20130426/52733_1 /TAXON_ID=127549 /ORGANISM="Calcidiscus leptoporus, Strain RCC1130" /LENGTH=108 /DNA_ID=CAMNT_0007398963 /DNA_START=77 /DNA_END=401 /DNA_ORIENTATION=+